MNALQRFQSFPMMQLNCCLLLLLLTLQCQNGQVTRARPDIKLTACNTSENAKNRNSKCICNETVVDCTKTFHRMQSVPDKILYTIKKLYLNGNAINKINEKDFIEFDRLEQLFLQDNTISVIHPRAFASLFRLEILNLSNNRIQALDPSGQTFQHLSGLRELHLQNNQITQINKYSFLTLTAPSKIVTVHLGGNPVQCDCDVQALRSWTRSLTVGTVQIRNLTCANDHMKPYEDVDEALFKQCAPGQGQMFGGIITCPTCSNERTNHGCNLNGARQCYGEQMACHKILEWDSGLHEMKITSKCDNYTSCMAEEAQNQQQCGVSYRESDIKLCHFCCYGPTCTTESIGGRTKDYTFDLSYIRDNAVYEPHMADIGHPRYLQEEERIDKGIRLAVTGISGGIDVYLVQFEPQPNDQYKVVLKLRVTTFSFMPDSIEDDIRNSILLSLSQQGSFFSGENIVPESLSLTADTQDSSPCPEDVSFSTDKGTITWHASPEGKVFMLCPYANVQNPGTSNAVRTCSRKPDGSVAWGEADYSSCPSMSDQEPVTLDKLFETPITTSNAKAVSAMLKTYMESVENLTGETADNFVNKLEMLLQDSMLQQRDVVNNVVECLSNLINSARTSDAFEQRNDISKRLLNIIDHISDKTPLVNGTLMLVTSNLAIAAQGVNASETLDVALTVDTDSTDGLLNNSKISVGLASRNTSRFTGSTSIVIPTRALVASMTPEERLDLSRISFVVHQTDTLFAATENNGLDGELQTNGTGNDYCLQNNSVSCQKENTRKFMTKINSQVVSANVPEVTVAGLKENITMNFIHNANATNPRCVFWNTNSSSGVAHWSEEGCGVVASGSGETTCGCNHLTNFALIMDVYQEGGNLSELDRKILSIISYVGCGISLIALIFTLLTYSCFRKLRSDNPSKILINLCLALMLSNLVYLVGMHDYTFDNTASCKTVAILLHYFLLSSLTWMAVEAFYMYLALILVFKTYFTNFILKCCLVGWGIPLVIVIITLGVNSTDNYGIINSGLCWLRNPAFYAAFVGPVCFILLINCLAFGLVMRQLVGISSSNLSKTDRNNTIQRLRGAVGIVVLLGLSWVFAIFAIGQASIAFYYLFAVCNSMQVSLSAVI